MSALYAVLLSLALPAPWLWSAYRRSQDRTLEGLIEQLAFGYALGFFALFVVAQLQLWLFVPLWCVFAVAVLLRKGSAGPLDVGREGAIVLGCALPYLALRSVPFWLGKLPIGWDAYFHMTIAESIAARGRAVHDWLPYEDLPLNYPIGAHLWLAFTQWVTGARPHEFFDALVVFFTCLTGLQIYALASRATRDRRVGCYAALAYLFWAKLGSYAYVLWSGLPNLIGMYLFLGLLSSLADERGTRAEQTARFVIYFLAACFVHHHVMVTAGVCLVWLTVARFAAGEREAAKRVASGAIASALIGLPYFAMYALRTRGLGQTEIAKYMERAADGWSIANDLGLGFAAAVALGVYVYFRRGERASDVVTQPLAAMLALYLAVEFLVRIGSDALFGQERSPFTPSRFLTDAVALLAVFAGLAFRSMEAQAKRPALALVLVLGFFVFQRDGFRATLRDTIPSARRDAYEWIREHAAQDAVLLDDDWHATYLTRRMSSGFPLPTSEFSAAAKNRERLREVIRGTLPIEQLGRQVLALVKPKRKPRGPVVWERAGLRVVERYAPGR